MKKGCVIKRKGIEEPYDEKKVYASVYSAAINCHYTEKKSEKLAEDVTKKVTFWATKHKCPDSKDIRKKVIEHLKDKDVILMYKSHLDLS